MHGFTAKKLGEVLAFCRVGLGTVELGRTALEDALGKEKVDQMITVLKEHEAVIGEFIEQSDLISSKAGETAKKMIKMRNVYVGDGWDKPTEVMEWLGFYEGGAIAHWKLVSGVASGLSNNKLTELSAKAIEFHQDNLELVAEALRTVGTKETEE